MTVHQNAVDYWITYVTRKAVDNGVVPFFWDIGSVIDRSNNSVLDQRTKAAEIIERYKNNPLWLGGDSVLSVNSNQKMNEYFKEIADICGITGVLNIHKARRTFGSTVTLNNNVPIHVVKEMLGHQSISQTEEYAITEQISIGREMQGLKQRLEDKENKSNAVTLETIEKMEKDLTEMKRKLGLNI